MRIVTAMFWAVSTVASVATAGPVDEIPAPFLPFEHMIGGWKGMAAPVANRVKGWQETHGWAWKFEKGKPVGLTVTLEGDKALAKGQITYDPAAKKYHLEGTDPQGKPVSFLGSFGPDGKILTLDRVGATPEGKERLIVRPNSNKIRYVLQIDRQEAGAPQYKKAIEVGLTKDGEAFAAGAGGADLPKCIMTGGAAGMTVSYQGKSYPVCCTGCRDEFNDNPEKYAKLAEVAMAKAAKAPSTSKPAAKGKDDGSFDGLIDEPKANASPTSPKAAAKEKADAPAVEPGADPKPAKPKDDSEAKANREVQLGQNFEKGGKNALALDHYRKVVKDHPGTEAAKTASARIKALEGK